MAGEAEGGDGGQDDGGPDGGEMAELRGRVDRLTGLVEKMVDGAHGASQDAVQDRLAAPGDVAAIVRAELARKDEQARDEDTRTKVESHAEVLAKLTEAPPVAPVTRRHRFMGWGS
jgi:hypothetical protein